MAYTRRHMMINIQGMLRFYGKKSIAGLLQDDGKKIGDKAARKYLAECLAKGWRVIPCGNCEGFDYQNGCPGHPITKEEFEKDK